MLTLMLGIGQIWATDPVTVKSTFTKATVPANNQVTDLEGEVTWNISTGEEVGSPTVGTGKYSGTEALLFGSSGSVYYKTYTLSTSYFKDYNVTSVKIYVRNNGSKKGTLTATQGSVTIGSSTHSTNTSAWGTLTVDSNKGAGGTLSVSYAVAQASYLSYIEVTYEAGTPEPALSFITVATAPTKTEYTEGEFFEPAGLVINANYDNSTSTAVAYDAHSSEFSFSPSLTTALATTNTSVTITWGEQSVDQAITVNAAAACTNTVTVSKGAETNGTYTLSAESVCGDGDGGVVFITNITPAEGYELDDITATVGTVDKDNNKVTGITANTEITVTFKALPKYTVSFNVGTGVAIAAITQSAYNADITLPAGTPSAACVDEGWTFAGWATAAVAEETTTAPTLLSGTYKPASDVTLYAVYKRTEGGDVEDASATETFTNQTAGTTYDQTQTYKASESDASIAWTMYYGTVSTNDAVSSGNNAQMRWYSSATSNLPYIKTTTTVSGLQNFSFKARVSNTNVKVSAWYSTDGENWTLALDNQAFTSTGTSGVINPSITVNGTLGTGYYIKIGVGSGSTAPSSGNYKLGIDDVVFNYKNGSSTNYYLSAPNCCTKYDITIDSEIEHGSVEADLAQACEGTEVTLTATPNDHCRFVEWNVTAGGNAVDVDANNKFSMPASDVVVSATFAEIKNAVNFDAPVGGTLVVKHNDVAITSGDEIQEGETLKLVYAASTEDHYIGGVVAVKDADNADVDVAADSTFVMPGKAVTVAATFTQTYAINIIAEGGNVALDYTAGGAPEGYALAGTPISVEATADDAHTFTSLEIEGVENPTIVDNLAEFTMPAGDVTITATFAAKTTPTINVDAEVLEFDPVDYKGELAAKTFHVSGVALAAGKLSIACNNAAFTVLPAEIDVNGTLVETEITVTPVTTTCGTFDGTITVSGGNATAKEILVSLTVNKLAANLSWSAEEATVTIDANDNVFPTLVNPRELEDIEFSSLDETVATIDASTGEIELVGPGETYIIANFAGNDTVVALAEDELYYTLTVQKKYTAKYFINGVEQTEAEQTALAGTDLVFPTDFSAFTDCSELTFVGWAEAAIEGKQDEAPTYTTKTVMPEADVNFYAVFATENIDEQESDPEWVATAYANLATNDVVVITHVVGEKIYALPNNNGTSSAPTATEVTIANDKLSAAPATTLQWDIAKNNDQVTFYVHGSTASWLYSTNTNNGTRVGNNTNATWELKSNYLFHVGTSRYLGVQASTDWRAYTSINSTITGQTLAFYKYTVSKTQTTTYSGYLTTCPSCAELTLTAVVDGGNGSIALQVGGKDVTSVKTCDPVVVDVVATPDDGYALASVVLDNENASYADGQISIPADETGTLTVTATFAAVNYTVTLEQTGGANAELSATPAVKHYGDEITVTAEDKEGYVFIGWSASPEVTFADAKALSTTFTMPASNVTVTAAYAKVYTVAEAIAKIDADGTTNGVVVEAYISDQGSYYSTGKAINYWLKDLDENGFLTGTAFEAYGGKGLNGADFNELNDIEVGAKVRVYGNITYYEKSSIYEFTSGSYQLEYVAPVFDKVVVYGTPVTAYEAGDEFDFTGLSAKNTYENGYAEAIDAPTWAADPATVYAAGTVNVTATANEQTSEAFPVEVTVNTHAVSLAAVEHGTVTLYVGEEALTLPANLVKGTTVNVTATPDEDYVLDGITVNGNALEGASFTVGTEAIEVAVTFNYVEPTYTIVVDKPLSEGSTTTAWDMTKIEKTDDQYELLLSSIDHVVKGSYSVDVQKKHADVIGGTTLVVEENGKYNFRFSLNLQGENPEVDVEQEKIGIATEIDNTVDGQKAVKVMKDNTIYIIRGDKTYTITGQVVK